MTTIFSLTARDPKSGKPYTLLGTDRQSTSGGIKESVDKIHLPEGMRYAVAATGRRPQYFGDELGLKYIAYLYDMRGPSENIGFSPADVPQLIEARKWLLTAEKPVRAELRQRGQETLLRLLEGGHCALVEQLNALQAHLEGDDKAVTSYLIADGDDSRHTVYRVRPDGEVESAHAGPLAMGSGGPFVEDYLQDECARLGKSWKSYDPQRGWDIWMRPEEAVGIVLSAVGDATSRDLYSSGLDLVMLHDGRRMRFTDDIDAVAAQYESVLRETLEQRVARALAVKRS